MDERVRRAEMLYERAVFSGDTGLLAEADRELDAAEADGPRRTHRSAPPPVAWGAGLGGQRKGVVIAVGGGSAGSLP